MALEPLAQVDQAKLAQELGRLLEKTAAGPPQVVFPDNSQSRRLSTQARFLEQRLAAFSNPLGRPAEKLAQICLLDGGRAFVGWRLAENSSPFPAGVPRLKLPAGSPSRSALKIEEALQVLLSEEERRRFLRAGLRAVDLGAAPGGWSLALARRGLLVTAVDRARLAPQVAGHDLVEHLREDGFTFRPSRPVEWLFCDIIDQPSRVAARIGEWLRHGWCRRAIFNLKLPMKRRLEQVERDLVRIRQAVGQEKELAIRCRQLYHDRREVTCYAFLSPG